MHAYSTDPKRPGHEVIFCSRENMHIKPRTFTILFCYIKGLFIYEAELKLIKGCTNELRSIQITYKYIPRLIFGHFINKQTPNQ